MQVGCSRCGQLLEYSHRPPRFCSNCGQPLGAAAEATQPFEPPTATPHHATSTVRVPAVPAAPERIGGYRLLRPLGSGGMGTVYEGEAEDAGGGLGGESSPPNSPPRRVAVKLIRPEFADSAETVERFRREGRLAGTIVYPRCVFVLAADEEAGRPYIVMELMPGDSLAERVRKEGPLPPAEAVTRVLDVIEGLQEMHRCGLVHRDVKPSNCFLDADGRVKVGDFGLSKSLVKDMSLTRTGAFLGTLLFAAPEQIRNDRVDAQADVYSVAATLYYLLTGHAPFEAADAAATLASIVSDPLTPLRHWRPELPSTLDEVVLRGLARSRERRWQNLEEFRLALLPFVPGPPALGEFGLRSAAYLVDALLLLPLEFGLLHLLHWAAQSWLHRPDVGLLVRLLLAFAGSLACGLLWFALPEWLWGCSAGKALFRFRVRTADRNDRPGLLRLAGRTTVFYLLKDAGPLLCWLLVQRGILALDEGTPGSSLVLGLLVTLPVLELAATGLGLLLLASTMRWRTGYRGVHEWASGTRVIRLPAVLARQLLHGHESSHASLARPTRLPEKIGAFTIQGALRWTDRVKVLVGEDTVLGRRVWIWLRPATEGPLAQKRRDVGRTTRPRWLASGRHAEWLWDAFVASGGCSLPELVQQRKQLRWPETQYLLEQLAEELAASWADGTLPPSLRLEQVWVQSNGRLQLLDAPLSGAAPVSGAAFGAFVPVGQASCLPEQPAGRMPAPPGPGGDAQGRALDLLAGLVRLTLEGKLPPATSALTPLRAPLPGYAARRLNRLIGVGRPYASVAEFHADLESVRDRPAEVSRPRRRVHLGLQGLALALGLLWMLGCVPLALFGAFATQFFLGARAEQVLADLHRDRPLQAVNLVAQTEPWPRLPAGGLLHDDATAAALLQRRLGRLERERQVMLESSSWFMRAVHDKWRDSVRFLAGQKGENDSELGEIVLSPRPADAARQLDSAIRVFDRFEGADYWLFPALLAAWPVLWTIWAFLWRGGLCFRLAGIALVQFDGQPAARWRCAWRALLVWLPFLLVLIGTAVLELARMAVPGPGQELVPSPWLAWLAWLTWWLALALLPLYCWLAQRAPGRALHDRLAGTYLVPR